MAVKRKKKKKMSFKEFFDENIKFMLVADDFKFLDEEDFRALVVKNKKFGLALQLAVSGVYAYYQKYPSDFNDIDGTIMSYLTAITESLPKSLPDPFLTSRFVSIFEYMDMRALWETLSDDDFDFLRSSRGFRKLVMIKILEMEKFFHNREDCNEGIPNENCGDTYKRIENLWEKFDQWFGPSDFTLCETCKSLKKLHVSKETGTQIVVSNPFQRLWMGKNDAKRLISR